MKTLIFDKNAGLLQWISSKTDEMDALMEFDDAVGIDPNETGLNLTNWRLHFVSDKKAIQVKAWADAGSDATNNPLNEE